jgi:hypothetical protein
MRDAYKPLTAAVEDRWRETYGDARVSKLRAVQEKDEPPGQTNPHLRRIGELREDSGD